MSTDRTGQMEDLVREIAAAGPDQHPVRTTRAELMNGFVSDVASISTDDDPEFLLPMAKTRIEQARKIRDAGGYTGAGSYEDL